MTKDCQGKCKVILPIKIQRELASRNTLGQSDIRIILSPFINENDIRDSF